MWKQLLINLTIILQLSVTAVPIGPIRNVEMECYSFDINKHYDNLHCRFLDVRSSKEQLNVSIVHYPLFEVEKLVNINIYGNESYPEYFPKHLGKLIEGTIMFTYRETSLKYLTRNDFADMAKYLHFLDLEGNQLEELPYDIFYDMPDLSYVHLNNNSLKSLPAGIFERTLNLETFHMESNKIKELEPDLFRNCPMLMTIYADFNEIEVLHEHLFKYNPQMSSIWFKNNKIRKIGIDFNKLPRLDSAAFLHNYGTCDVIFLGYEPSEGFYKDEEINVLIRSVPEFQKKILEFCKG